MTADQLNFKWNELSKKPIMKGFRSLILATDCYANIFIGVNNEANRCLILAIPDNYEIEIKSVIKENLRIDFYSETGFIVLQLTDPNFADLFDDLIVSLYQRIKSILVVREYIKEFVQSFYKWSEFFANSTLSNLSDEIIKGLYGELIVLKSLVENSGLAEIDNVLNYWRGPYDQVHDFVLPSKNIEVKTKEISSLDIKISSEYQLQAELDKGLELCIVNIQTDLNGLSIKDLVFDLKILIIDKLGDSSILFKALLQKGLFSKTLNQYDYLRFQPIDQITYDCTSINFPRLTKNTIPYQINSIKYNIRTSSITEFIISEKKF